MAEPPTNSVTLVVGTKSAQFSFDQASFFFQVKGATGNVCRHAASTDAFSDDLKKTAVPLDDVIWADIVAAWEISPLLTGEFDRVVVDTARRCFEVGCNSLCIRL